MKLYLAILILAVVARAAAADEVPAFYKMSYGPYLGEPLSGEYTVVLQGQSYTTRAALLAAVEQIPERSRIAWFSGCIAFPEIPLGPHPRMTMAEFKAFCARRQIRFNWHWGSSQPTSRKTFTVSPNLFAPLVRNGKATDLREWFKAQGVSFPSHTFAQWQPANQLLCVRNTQENLDLIELLLQDAQSKQIDTEPTSRNR